MSAAVAEAPAPTAVALPGRAGTSIKAGILTRLLKNALPFTSNDIIPVIASVRLDAAKGTLTTIATDRYKVLRQRSPLDDARAKWAVTLPVESVRDLLALIQLAGRGRTPMQRQELSVWLQVNDKKKSTHTEVDVSVGDYSTSFVCVNGTYPDVDKLFPAEVTAAAVPVHLNPDHLVAFGAVKSGESRPMVRFTVTDENKPVHFTMGEDIDGLLMPMRPAS